MGIETSLKITQRADKDSLGPTSKHPFAFNRGINVAKREKGALFPQQAACSCLLPRPKKFPAMAVYQDACTTFECWRRRVSKGKTEVVEAMEGEGVHAPFQ
jgi:hypothetical protein